MAVAPRMYARSLFQAAKETGKLEIVHAELGQFATAVDEVPELRGLLSNPQIERDDRAAALREILADADELVRNFVLLLSEKGRTAQLDEVYKEFDALVAADAGRLTVELTTAYELSDDEAASIVKKIEQERTEGGLGVILMHDLAASAQYAYLFGRNRIQLTVEKEG